MINIYTSYIESDICVIVYVVMLYVYMLFLWIDLKAQIARTQSEIVREQRQVAYWTEYKDKGQHEHKKQIMLLEQELVDMQRSFDEMAGKYC